MNYTMKDSIFKFALMVFAIGFVVEFAAQTVIGDQGEAVTVVVENDSTATAHNIDAIVDEIIQHIDNRPVGDGTKEWVGWIFAGILLLFNVLSWVLGRFGKRKE